VRRASKGRISMSGKPQLSITLPTLVVVSGTASGLGTHIANQLVDCGVAIGVDIAARPNGNARRRRFRRTLWVSAGGSIAIGDCTR
jgi:hypothetical protein